MPTVDWSAEQLQTLSRLVMIGPRHTEARAAEGNICAEARTIDGLHHALSAWVDESSMQAILVNGGHIAAMKAFRHIATEK